MIRHSSAFKPRIYAHKGDITPQDVDRCQSFRVEFTKPNEKVYEHGRKNEMDRDWKIPEVRASLMQFEYGNIDIFKVLANLSDMPSGGFELEDFDDSSVDIVTFEENKKGGTYLMSRYAPKLVLSSFGLSIGDSEAKLERTFEFAGDDAYKLRKDNKCFIFKSGECASGETTVVIDCSDPAPVEDPNNAGKYMLKVIKVTGVGMDDTSDLTASGYVYDAVAKTLTVTGLEMGDVIKIYYSASSFGSAGNPNALNDVDDYYIKAEQISVYLIGATENYVHKLSSLALTASFDRMSEGELGSDEKILKEAKDHAVSITLSGYVESATIDEILMGQAGNDWGIVDVRKFVETINLVVAIYDSADKDTFKMGYVVENMKYPSGSVDVPVNDFLGKDITFEADNLKISTVKSDLGLS